MLIPTVPLEDELGDVLEKAMRRGALTEEILGERTGVAPSRIRDAVNYRSELTCEELRRLAAALALNEIGLCAIGCGRYPLPEAPRLSFYVHPLQMQHGIGVVNAYIVAEESVSHGILFDTGPGIASLAAAWPRNISAIDAVFVTHVETEHVGGLCDVVERFEVAAAYCPAGASVSCAIGVGEAQRIAFGEISVTAFSTPGHTPSHNCYLVTSCRGGPPLLISGDLFFAGSAGCVGSPGTELEFAL